MAEWCVIEHFLFSVFVKNFPLKIYFLDIFLLPLVVSGKKLQFGSVKVCFNIYVYIYIYTTPIQKIRIMKRNMVKGNENRIYQINNQQYQI